MALGLCRRLCRPGRLLALLLLLTVLPLLLLIRPAEEGAQIRIAAPQQRGDWFSVRLAEDQREYIDTKGVHVVVGHYMGEPAISSANLTDEILNTNAYSPVPYEGRDGQPVLLPPHVSGRMQTLFRINRFNLMASDRIPLNRSLPDVRKKRCRSKKYPEQLPTASVIIVFHNEAWSTLLRTVWSVINRSPKSALKEILLIDDASTRTFLGEPLDRYVSSLPVSVRVLRAERRTGLVRARVLGATSASGEVLVFLDAHCECTKGWLEPLLSRVAEDRTKVVCPVIDILSDDTLAYVRSFELHWGAFNWELHFRWYTMGGSELRSRKDTTIPFKTPTMAGGLFAMDKNFFFELGSYDEQMEIWGGENLELSFRVWQCGGAVEIAPCSHVGHLFRKSSPYSFPGGVGGVLYGNLARVAMVWMDEWANFYFKFNPDAAAIRDKINVTDRLALRDRLQCRSFEWYLDNVWPEHFMPKDDRFFGKVRNEKSGECLLKPTGRGSLNQPAGAATTTTCAADDNADAMLLQMWVHTPEGALATDESVCLDAGPPRSTSTEDSGPIKARVVACSGSKRQQWQYDDETKQLKHDLTGLCLQSSTAVEDGQESYVLITSKCNISSSDQRWIFEEVDWK